MRARTTICLLVAYYCVAMLTGAYWYQHRRDPNRLFHDEVAATWVGMMWPLYWSGRAAMRITE